MNQIAANLKQLRARKGILLKELAQELHCSVGTVSNYENGVHSPDLDTLILLADYYGVSVDYLLGHTRCSCPVDVLEQSIQDGYTVGRFLELLPCLDDKDKAYLVYLFNVLEELHLR